MIVDLKTFENIKVLVAYEDTLLCGESMLGLTWRDVLLIFFLCYIIRERSRQCIKPKYITYIVDMKDC